MTVLWVDVVPAAVKARGDGRGAAARGGGGAAPGAAAVRNGTGRRERGPAVWARR